MVKEGYKIVRLHKGKFYSAYVKSKYESWKTVRYQKTWVDMPERAPLFVYASLAGAKRSFPKCEGSFQIWRIKYEPSYIIYYKQGWIPGGTVLAKRVKLIERVTQ